MLLSSTLHLSCQDSCCFFMFLCLRVRNINPSGLRVLLFAAALSESVKTCGSEALALLGQMKQQDSLAAADSSKLRVALEAILTTAEVRVTPIIERLI